MGLDLGGDAPESIALAIVAGSLGWSAVFLVHALAGRIIVTGLLIWWLRKIDRPLLQAACGLIIGGALGNIIDSLVYGAVTDFLDFYWGVWHFPTFNVADTCISIGAGLWLLDAALAPSHSSDQNDGQTGSPAAGQTKD